MYDTTSFRGKKIYHGLAYEDHLGEALILPLLAMPTLHETKTVLVKDQTNALDTQAVPIIEDLHSTSRKMRKSGARGTENIGIEFKSCC